MTLKKNIHFLSQRISIIVYLFLLILSFAKPLALVLGFPLLLLIELTTLIVIGLTLNCKTCEKIRESQDEIILKYFFIAALYINLFLLIFGQYFNLFSDSIFFLLFFGMILLFALKSKLIIISGIILGLTFALIAIIDKFSLDKAGNMLSFIEIASNLLLSGKNPYFEEVNVLGFTYPFFLYAPLMLIAYIPLVAMHIDIRYINVISVAFFLMFYYFITKRGSKDLTWEINSLEILSIISSPYVIMLITTKHIFFYGLILTFLSYSCLKNDKLKKSVLVALAFNARQYCISIFFPVIYEKKVQIIQIIRNIIVVTGIVGLFWMPFFIGKTSELKNFLSGGLYEKDYNNERVDFSKRFSPGGGSSFNIAHLIKYVMPSWETIYNKAIIIGSWIILWYFLIKEIISRIKVIYFSQLIFIEFSWNFSEYFLWDPVCIAIGVILYNIKFLTSKEESSIVV